MASATPSESVDSELRCSICLGTFVCPSTLSCGHSFCLRCLEAAWETASSFSCPQCRATFPVRPQLRRNVALANLAEQLRVGDGMAAAVVCDTAVMHTPAVKTCLRCEMSFCATHLRPHLENPRLSDHVLVAPIANLEERRCRSTDRSSFFTVNRTKSRSAQSAPSEETTLDTGHRSGKSATDKTGGAQSQEGGERGEEEHGGVTARTLRDDYRYVEESVRGIKARISREFERRREQLKEEEREALERVDEEGRSALSRIQADIARYESRARGLEQEINQLLAALAVQDPLSFLQDPLHESLRRSSISQETQDDPAPVSHGLNLGKFISVGGVQTKLLPFLGLSALMQRDPLARETCIHSGHETGTQYVYTNTHHRWTLTDSGHKLSPRPPPDFLGSQDDDAERCPQGRPHHPHRFDVWPQALCSESFSSGQHYWEVDVGSARLCRVGVAYGTIPRRGTGAECGLGGSDVSWCLQKQGDSFSVRHGGVETSLSVPQPPRRVGVHLDWDAGLLSFYSADSMALLHSFNKTFTQPLHPGLWVGWRWGGVGDSVRIVDLSGAS
ncbi:LOW QUALITY PROTEIN: E3 ubiquitin-protein ligase TRIM11-like [Callorhinchus milii]|uniref:LOW QUALITY PROTEIN: E3 ubiquitin-protein ligase TRIM11-like n=1 Tax=Callorhinchus milii TaxID=7868 RepID=UPI001C3FD5C0|nr:LOW QUALITY PROTEIN: E3 ubiquitin-protein ligase TRIM11-like [Callorhinchus milii]